MEGRRERWRGDQPRAAAAVRAGWGSALLPGDGPLHLHLTPVNLVGTPLNTSVESLGRTEGDETEPPRSLRVRVFHHDRVGQFAKLTEVVLQGIDCGVQV